MFNFQGDSVDIFEHISKSIKSPEEKQEDQRMSNAEQVLAEEQKPLFEVNLSSQSENQFLLHI